MPRRVTSKPRPEPKLPKAAKPSKPKAAKPEEVAGRQTALVVAAYELIAEKGLEELRTRDIAAKVGINISTLHYYFPTKQALIRAVVEHMKYLFSTVRLPSLPGGTALEDLKRAFENQTYRRRADPRLEIVIQELMLRARRDPDVQAALAEMLAGWHWVITHALLRCVKEGSVRKKLDIKAATLVITSYLVGVNMQHSVLQGEPAFENAWRSLFDWLSA